MLLLDTVGDAAVTPLLGVTCGAAIVCSHVSPRALERFRGVAAGPVVKPWLVDASSAEALPPSLPTSLAEGCLYWQRS